MKKIFSVLLMLAFLVQSTGVALAESNLILSDTTTVNVDNTSDKIYAKPTSDEYHISNDYYMHFKTSGDWLEVSQNLTSTATAGGQYVMTVVVKPVSGTVWFRVGWDDTGWLSSTQTVFATDLGDGWLKYEKTVTLSANQTNFLFHNDGATEFYIGSISLVPVNGVGELLVDSGFDSVNYDAQTDTYTPALTTVNVTNTDNVFAKILKEENTSENTYSLHMYTEGDWLEIGQNYTQELTAGDYTLTWYAKGEGILWFYSNWGGDANPGEFAATHAVDSAIEQPDGWTMYRKNIYIDGVGDTSFLFHNDGAVDLYIDDISLVDANGVNYIVDGSFGEVTEGEVPGGDDNDDDTTSLGDRYKNKLLLSETTIIGGANNDTCYAEATIEQFRGDDGFSLHFVSSGDNNFKVSQKIECKVGQEYVLTVYAKPVSGMVWFRAGWGENAWMAVDSADKKGIQSDGWYKYQKTITVEEDATSLFFYSEGDAAEFYIDDISLIKVDDTENINLMPDGGFEEVTFPDYDILMPVLKNETETVESISEAGTYTVKVAAKNNALEEGLPVELLVAVFDSSDEMVNLYSDKADVEMSGLREADTVLCASFEVDEGYTAEVYVINNRQDIDVYYSPVSYKSK